MKRLKYLAAILLVASFAAAPAFAKSNTAPAGDAAPTAIIKNFYATLADTMKQGNDLGFGGRYKKLEPAIKTSFNLPLMTRFAVGPVWMKASADEQKQLVSAFSDFSVATYASRFAKFGGEKFEVIDQKPATGGGVIVETKLTPGDSTDPVALNYLMRQDDKGTWRIVDVFLDGSISELATRRSEFTSIVNRDGIGALVNQLGEKSRELGPS